MWSPDVRRKWPRRTAPVDSRIRKNSCAGTRGYRFGDEFAKSRGVWYHRCATMRILACADLHGRPERIARVRALAADHAPAVILLPGDLTHAGFGREALELLRSLPVPVLAVSGNMDAPFATTEIRRRGRLGGPQPVVIEGTAFGGPGLTQRVDVLVVHEPPLGTLDLVPSGQHIGSQQVLDLMIRLRPRLLTCGHVHESPGIERVGETLVVNCTMGDGKTGGALIELTDDRVDARLL